MKIALTGNPNSGKTTLFNEITGKIEHVGNWAGVTVDKKEGRIKKELNKSGLDLIAVDLPGAYSMSPYTNEESITSDFVKKESPDVIINIVDSTNLSRSLFFTTQLLELGIPVVIALNKWDLADKKQTRIDSERLSEILRCPVIKTAAVKSFNNGLDNLINAVIRVGKSGHKQKPPKTKALANAATQADFEAADKKRFEIANKIVSEVERKKSALLIRLSRIKSTGL